MSLARSKVKAVILTGDGINCEEETALAIRELGAEAVVVHIQELIEKPSLLESAHMLVLPGGFSFFTAFLT